MGTASGEAPGGPELRARPSGPEVVYRKWPPHLCLHSKHIAKGAVGSRKLRNSRKGSFSVPETLTLKTGRSRPLRCHCLGLRGPGGWRRLRTQCFPKRLPWSLRCLSLGKSGLDSMARSVCRGENGVYCEVP